MVDGAGAARFLETVKAALIQSGVAPGSSWAKASRRSDPGFAGHGKGC